MPARQATQAEVDQFMQSHPTFYCQQMKATITERQCKTNQKIANRALKNIGKPIHEKTHCTSGEFATMRNERRLWLCANCQNGVKLSKEFKSGQKKLIRYAKDLYKRKIAWGCGKAEYIEDHGNKVDFDNSDNSARDVVNSIIEYL